MPGANGNGRKYGNGKSTSKSTLPTGALVIPGKNGGRLRNGGTSKGGTGRPPSQLRERMREVGWRALEEIAYRFDLARIDIPPSAELERLTKQQLIELLAQVRPFVGIGLKGLQEILDTSAKYGVGTRTELAGGEENEPIRIVLERSA